MGLFDEITDIFFGGDEVTAANREAGSTREGALIGLQGAREALQYHQNTTRPIRYGGGAAYNAYLNAVGLGGDQQNFSDEYNFGGAGQGTTFGVPTGGPYTGAAYDDLDQPGNGQAILATGALLARSPTVRGAVGNLAQRAFPEASQRVSGLLGGGGEAAGQVAGQYTNAAGQIVADAGSGALGAGTAGATYLGPGGAAGAAPGQLAGGTTQLPGYDFGSGAGVAGGASGAAGGALSPASNVLAGNGIGSVLSSSAGTAFSGAGSAAANLQKFGGAALGGILAGYTADGSRGKKIGTGVGAAAGAQYGATVGTAVGGPVGGFIGGAIGGVAGGVIGGVGGQIRGRNSRSQLHYDNTTGQFISPDGTLQNAGDIRQSLQNGELTPNPDYPGMFDLPVGSLDGHRLLIDAEGNVRSGTNGRELTEPFWNIHNDAGEIRFNGQGVTQTGGGHKGYGSYDPSLSTFGQQPVQPTQQVAGQIGIPSGEGPGGFLGGTQIIPQDGLPPDAGQAIPGLASQTNLSPGVTGNLPTDSEYGGFLSSPNYNYIRDEVTRGVSRNAVAKGDIGNRYDDDMAQRIAGIASGNYQNYLANLQNAFAPGTAAIQQLGSAGQQGLNNGYLNYGQGIANAGSVLAVGGLRESEAQRNTFGSLGRLFV